MTPTSLHLPHIGIAGHSHEGAALCWLETCRHSLELGMVAHPDITMDCISFERSMHAWNSEDYATVRSTLGTTIDRLHRAGADFFLCPDNTAHLALESEGESFPIPGLHIVDVVAETAAKRGFRRVAVLGTRFTMNGPLYPRELAERGIEALVPTRKHQEFVDRSIFTHLVNGRVPPDVRRGFEDLAEVLVRDAGCDAIAAVCTEIPLALTSANSPVPVLDSTRLLARAAAEVASGARPAPTWRGGRFR